MANVVSTFEIHATDPDKSAEFYAACFDWTLTEANFGEISYYEISDSGIFGRIIKRHGDAPVDGAPVMGAVITVTVDNIDKTGGTILSYGGVEALPKFALPAIGWMAYYKDIDGNVFGVFQNDEGAK